MPFPNTAKDIIKVLKQNHSTHLKDNKRQSSLEINMSDYGTGTWVQVVSKDMSHYRSVYMIFSH